MSQPKKPAYGNHKLCHTGEIPPSQVGRSIAGAYQYHKNWRQRDLICRYIGVPGSDYHGGQVNSMYILSPVVAPADPSKTTRKYQILCSRWNYDFWSDPGGGADYDNNVLLNGSPLGSYTATIRSAYDYATGTPQTDDDPPAGPVYNWIADITQSTSDSQYLSGYRWDLLRVDDISIAGFSVITMPEYYLTTAASQGLVKGNFSSGHTLRGYTSSTETGTSVGAVVHNTDNDTDGIVQNTRRCIFNYIHPGGCFIIGSGAAGYLGLKEYTDSVLGLTPLPFLVEGRNLRFRTSFPNDNCDVVLMAQWDTGTKLKITSDSTSDTLVYNFVGSQLGTPAIVVIADALRYDPRGDSITVEFEVSSTAAVIIHSFSIFETAGAEI